MLVPVVTAASMSPAKKPPLIHTVPETRFGLLTSLTVVADDRSTGAAFRVCEAVATVSVGAEGAGALLWSGMP